MRTKTLVLTAVLAGMAMPAVAQDYDNPRQGGGYGQVDDRDHHDDRGDGHRDNGHHYGRDRNRDDHGDRRNAGSDYRSSGAYWQQGKRYDWNRPDPNARGYYADRYYRDGRNYQPRYLGANDRIYRGNDGRYYCRRNDGTTGLIIGAVGGGVLGNAIAPGGSKTVGTLAGGVLGALLGQSIDRGNQRIQCR